MEGKGKKREGEGSGGKEGRGGEGGDAPKLQLLDPPLTDVNNLYDSNNNQNLRQTE